MVQTTQLQEVYFALEADFQTSLQSCRDNDSLYLRRTMIRSAAALIEGVVNQLSSFTLEAIQTMPAGVFTDAEISVLKEEAYGLDPKGKIKSRPNHQTLLSRLLFNTNCYLKLFGLQYKLETGHNGWNSLKQLIHTRNRLMHPKSLADLEVSDEDVNNAAQGLGWFGIETAKVIGKSNDAYAKTVGK